MDSWQDEVSALCAEAKELLERAIGAPTFRSSELQHAAIVCLMEAVEVHNDNFRFKVTNDGKTKVSQ